MKLKYRFIINNVAGDNIAVPVGKESNFKGYIRLNETGKDIFEMLKKNVSREKIVSELQKKYPQADTDSINKSVENILNKLEESGLLI